jgi:UPF0716 protein FxsA
LRFVPLILIGGIAAEVWVFIKAGEAFGAWTVVLAVIAAMFAGAAVIQRQGLRSLDGLRRAFNGGSLQEVNAADAALVYLAGLFLILPGFISDAVGVALLIPLVRRIVRNRLGRHVVVSETQVWSDGRQRQGPLVIEGEAVDVTPQAPANPDSPWKA